MVTESKNVPPNRPVRTRRNKMGSTTTATPIGMGKTLPGGPRNSGAPGSSKGGVLPGEKNPSAPTKGKPRPMPTEPSPAGRYGKLKKAFAKPGIQPGENDAIAAIMKNRGVSRARAVEIGKFRTQHGLKTANIMGPNGDRLHPEPGRKPVKNPRAARPAPATGPVTQPTTKPTPGNGSVPRTGGRKRKPPVMGGK